jgi:hypothetical protein
MYSFKVNTKLTDSDRLYYKHKNTSFTLDVATVELAINNANADFRKQFEDMDKGVYKAPLLRNIPLKNLSGSVGECFGVHLCMLLGNIQKNPHEASAPDFIPTVPSSKQWFTNPTKEYYALGGFDTKASYSKDKKFTGAKAFSHHTQTSTILVVQWAMSADKIPEIIGIYYTNKLTPDDWKMSNGKTNSKTTPSARLNADGIRKLRAGWLVLRSDVVLPKKWV